jgi:hypothetical protein
MLATETKQIFYEKKWCAEVYRHFMFLVNALVFGLTAFAVLCATPHYGAHLNPAVTVASMLAGITGALQAAVFIIVQACFYKLLPASSHVLRFVALLHVKLMKAIFRYIPQGGGMGG